MKRRIRLTALVIVLALCGTLLASASADGHVCGELRWVEARPAGCTNGNIRYGVCDVCNTWYSDAFPDGIITNHADVVIPGTGHAPSASWQSDADSHWRVCTNSGCGKKLDVSAHTPGEDDGDCTTPVLCTVCGETATAGKAQHAPSEGWESDADGHWHACANSGCNEKLDFAAHTPDKDDGDCTTPVRCTVCGGTMAGKTHAPSEGWESDADGHWHACANPGCDARLDFAAHTPDKDDGDCTTPVRCAVCGKITTAAFKEHDISAWSYLDNNRHERSCTRSGCKKGYSYEDHSFGWFFTSRCQECGAIIKEDGRCYIATCVYGSYDCPEVWTLRRFRDDALAQTAAGRLFIKLYYAVSPTLVDWFGETDWFRALGRFALDALTEALESRGFASTPYADKTW